MSNPVIEKLNILESGISRAIETIANLREEKNKLEKEKSEMEKIINLQKKEIEELKVKVSLFPEIEKQNKILLREREELLKQIDAVLKELEKI